MVAGLKAEERNDGGVGRRREEKRVERKGWLRVKNKKKGKGLQLPTERAGGCSP